MINKTPFPFMTAGIFALFSVCAFVFLTGFIPFAPGELYVLFGQTPWLHRAFVLGFAMAAVILLFLIRNSFFLKAIFEKFQKNLFAAPWILFLFCGSLWAWASVMRHQSFKSGFDMAIFTQAVWNTVHGNFLYSSIKGGICLLGDHFSPFLAAFSLPFALWPRPEILLIFQAFGAVAAIFPLYRLAQKKGMSAFWALVIVLCFCLYLPLRNSVRFEFHPEILAIPMLLWAYVFLFEKRFAASSLMLALALSSKESLAPVTLMFGAYAFLKGHKRFGLFWTFFSPLYLWAVTKIWIPAISGQDYFYLSGNFLAWKEEGILALAKHLFNQESLAYFIKIYAPTAGLSFFDPSFLLNLPALAQNLTSRNEATRSIFFQYTATLTPFVFISALNTLARLYPRKIFLITFAGSSLLMAGVSDFYIGAQFHAEKAGFEHIPEAFKKISSSASVRTHEFFAAHLANRKELHIFENNHPLEGGSVKARTSDFVILHKKILGNTYEQALRDLEPNYRLESESKGLLIFKRYENA